MKNADNIEKLFKDSLENFEADVNPNIWTNVQSGINSGAGSAAGTAAKFALGKIIAGTVAVGIIAGSVWYVSKSENKTIVSSQGDKSKIESVSNPSAQEQKVISENKSSNNLSETKSSEQKVSSTQSSPANNSGNSVNDASVANNTTSSSENPTTSSLSQPEHKYGNASQGDGGMMRATQTQNSKSTSADNSTSTSEENDAETNVPVVSIFVNTTSGDVPLTVNFINQGTATALNWDFGDGSFSRENAPAHTFEKVGNYEVTLTAKNSAGSASAKTTIEVKSISSVGSIPNVFTPNGDGANDIFHFELKNISSIGVAIYSQGNGNVYTWNILDGSWSGKLSNGNDAPPGVYFYSIQAMGTDGILHSESGSVTLSR